MQDFIDIHGNTVSKTNRVCIILTSLKVDIWKDHLILQHSLISLRQLSSHFFKQS